MVRVSGREKERRQYNKDMNSITVKRIVNTEKNRTSKLCLFNIVFYLASNSNKKRRRKKVGNRNRQTII